PPLAVSRIATFFGLLTGGLEILNVALENLLPAVWHGAAISIPLMLLPFLLWATAAALATRRTGKFRSGLLAGVLSAAFCMLAAVTAGFLVELDLRPPSTASVATWAEYLRSHWTDPRAFAIANTLDSGFTHLFFAPIVAAILGSLGSGLTLLAMRRSNPMAQSH
ncbi:MAG TPA: hypothetical protein VHC72_11220, partial [Bryobacteraceae bacterium]|nr:hypothetical protein [Bryobacteraceae bacterium]